MGRVGWPMAAGLLIWACLVIAAARPQFQKESPRLHGAIPVEVMLAMDLSASMDAEDLTLLGKPASRLAVASALAREVAQRLAGNRIGLIIFGSRAYVHTPLTLDGTALQEGVATLQTGMAGNGTALGDAIALASKRLKAKGAARPTLLVLSDGKNTAGKLSPAQAVWLARQAGITIHTVMIAAQGKGRDAVQQEAASEDLQDISGQTGGLYVRATDGGKLKELFASLGGVVQTPESEATAGPPKELYPWPLGVALGLSFLLSVHFSRPREG